MVGVSSALALFFGIVWKGWGISTAKELDKQKQTQIQRGTKRQGGETAIQYLFKVYIRGFYLLTEGRRNNLFSLTSIPTALLKYWLGTEGKRYRYLGELMGVRPGCQHRRNTKI